MLPITRTRREGDDVLNQLRMIDHTAKAPKRLSSRLLSCWYCTCGVWPETKDKSRNDLLVSNYRRSLRLHLEGPPGT